jgi:GR25 family glycosyltransferase involved in LPS biosynthesis
MEIFYINRDCDHQRRKHIQKVLRECNLSGRRFKAVTPETLPTIEFEPPVIHRSITDIACLSSHLLLIKALNLHCRSWPVLILEDDCVLPDWISLEAVIKSAPEGWEALQLATSTSQHLMQLYKYWTDCKLTWHG